VKRLRIAQVATSDISIRFLVMEHICALRQSGHEVVAVCSPGPWVQDVRESGIEVITIPMARELAPLTDCRSFFALQRCFREKKFDVVHTHTPKAGLLGPLAARRAGVRFVVHTIHGLLFHDRQPRWEQWLYWIPERITAVFADRLLSQSREDMETCVRRYLCTSEKVTYIGNGIDVQRFPLAEPSLRQSLRHKHGFLDEDFIIGSVGRLVREKGFEELFTAAEQLRGKLPQAKFLVVGPREEGEQRDAIPSQRLRELEAKGIVRFPGVQTNMAEWLSLMDAFVLPSHREGIPRACMEAACMGLPVIASDIRGCREVVVNEETGILVPMKNPQLLEAAMARLVNDRALGRSMGGHARERIKEHFDSRQVLARLCEFYEGVAGRPDMN
jgi:glycosyltransferase involved in cell wall biosynthesis